MRSGIAPSRHLSELGITTIGDLPVGDRLRAIVSHLFEKALDLYQGISDLATADMHASARMTLIAFPRYGLAQLDVR
jgi:hypothetical protein